MTTEQALVPELKSANQLVAELRGEAPDQSIEIPEDPKDAKEYTFAFRYEDSRGKLWTGKFTNRILTVGERRRVKILKAQMAVGLPVSALDADQWELNEIIAHLSVSLVRNKNFPNWAEDLEALYDEGIIYKLYEEVASHEAKFRRREEPSEESKSSNSDRIGEA